MKVLDHGFVRLSSKTGHVGLSVVEAARCSFGSEADDMGERDRKLVKYLLGAGHTSPFRHAYFTLHVKAPLFVFRQWWKYQVGSTWREYELEDGTPVSLEEQLADRAQVVASDVQIDTDQGCSWNELSGRYKVMQPEFYVPEKARRNTGKQASDDADDEHLDRTLRHALNLSHLTAMESYEKLLKQGVAKELARLVLPPTIYSECYWTVSLQAALHFLDQRLKPDAQFEIRQYAQAVLSIIKPDLTSMGVDFDG